MTKEVQKKESIPNSITKLISGISAPANELRRLMTVVEMTESCSEEDKESLYNLISDARDEIDGLKDQIIARQNKLSSDTNKSNKAKMNYNVA